MLVLIDSNLLNDVLIIAGQYKPESVGQMMHAQKVITAVQDQINPQLKAAADRAAADAQSAPAQVVTPQNPETASVSADVPADVTSA